MHLKTQIAVCEVWSIDGKLWANVHPKSDECALHGCPLHYPSTHHMSDWPMILRRSTLVVRECDHGLVHPDPDSLDYFRRNHRGYLGIHSCDGCCVA